MFDAVNDLSDKKYGISDPVTTDGPSKDDIEASEEVVELLRSYKLFETNEGKQRRENALESINRLFQQFIRRQAAKCLGIPEDQARSISGRLLTFGSYRLGIVTPDSDIDVLCLCPQCVTREVFFTEFYNTLASIDVITKLHAVPDAYTPVIKMVYDGIDVDVLFANLMLLTIPENIDILDDSILRNMNEVTARSVNGCRVASFILSSVPNKINFRIALRYVKLWATRRGIYTTVMGYMGGVAWAILTARVCQLYPNYVASQLIEKFFRVYSLWNWKFPVMLCKIKEVPNLPGFMSFKVWDPRSNPHDRQHLMPVITPAFPSMNSTHNVTATTKRILTEEFKRARDILKTKNVRKMELWELVLEKEDIFSSHKHFLMIEIFASSEHVHGKWEGWIGSRMRFLIKKLEIVSEIQLRPWPEFFKFKNDEWAYASAVFFAFKCILKADKGSAPKTFDIRPSIRGFKEIINSWGEFDTLKDQIDVSIKYLKSSQLPSFVLSRRSQKRTSNEISNST